MTTTTSTAIRSLSEEALLRFRERAGHHDALGRYAVEDLADLRAAGWVTAALPEELGGLGLNLAELGGEQRRMARYSPATALSTCMHQPQSRGRTPSPAARVPRPASRRRPCTRGGASPATAGRCA